MQAVKTPASVKELTAADVMLESVEVIAGEISVSEAGRILCERNARHLIVVDANRRPVGVISPRDVLNGYEQSTAGGCSSVDSMPVAQLIKGEVVTVAVDGSLGDVERLLRVVGCLPVVDESRQVVGIIELVDMMKRVVRSGKGREEEFEFFQPGQAALHRRNLLAYIRRSSGSLVLPIGALGDEASEWNFARLGYDATSGRILVQMSTEPGRGALKINRTRLHDGHYLAIDANQFVDHFRVDFEGRAYSISGERGSLMLTPRS